MSTVETIPQGQGLDHWPEPPRLLVEWSSPWEEFKTSLRPALRKSPKHLAGEAPIGMFPYRGMLLTWILEVLALFLIIVIPARIASLQPYTPPPIQKWDVIYYTGDELPRTEDAGGAQAGKSGRAGGQEAHHRTQTIRVARGSTPTEKVVDAPKLNLPKSDSSVANLLAFKPIPGPPPAEGLRSTISAPALPAPTVVPPTPELNSTLTRKPDSLTANVVAPAPDVARANARPLPSVNAPVVAPAPEVKRDQIRGATVMNPSVVAPAPNSNDAQRDLASSRSSLTQTANVIAPPVSAPQRDTSSAPKLTLPAPTVIAPPPSQLNRELNSWGGSATGDLHPTPVPPPPSLSGGGSFSRTAAGELSTQVVPPPVSADGGGLKGSGNTRAGGSLLGSTEVVPPPPSLGGGKALSGSGRGNKGSGTGNPLDVGAAAAPPGAGGGSAAGSGVVVSNKPGTQVGVPSASNGAIAMSPSGTANTGLGGNGGGAGLGKGNGPGSGLQGESTGAGKEGAGPGSDPNAKSGISPYPGSGGAGIGTPGAPSVPGVSVQNGNTITLPSFGPPVGDTASGPGRSSANNHKRSGITVECTSSSCGVFGIYGRLKGTTYTIYIETSLGTAVMQYADASVAHAAGVPLTEPEPIRKDLPPGLRTTRVVIACVLDRSGVFKDLRVLEPGATESTSKILAALPTWKFRPAMRGNEPVEVTAIIGFGIDTR